MWRSLAPLHLLVLLAALHEPLFSAALADPMACCADPKAAMCCPLDGSCVLKTCHAEERAARLGSLTIFALPRPSALPEPCVGSDLPVPRPSILESGDSALPDPPPWA